MHLRAEMPAARMVSRGHMELRIARKVAALYGVAGDPQSSDDAGGGRAWLSDFSAITATELALGGPLRPTPGAADGGVFTRRSGRPVHVDDEVDPAVLPNATLADYGPDTRAALTLAGVNKILEPVTAAVQEALRDVLEQVDSPALLVAVGQCLLQEVFVAQPFLMLGALQAGQVQRALSLPGAMVRRVSGPKHPLARVEYGYGHREPANRPLHLDVVRELWRSVAAEGDTFHGDGAVNDASSGLRAKPLFDFDQIEVVGVAGTVDGRERLLALLTAASEASLVGISPGSPNSEIRVLDGGDRGPQIEVVVPRQRQIELMLSLLTPRLSRRLHAQPVPVGGALRLPIIDVPAWRAKPLLHRRAILLAHYYSLRAAGWISGMTRFNHRRNRDDCAQRCVALVAAAADLLEPGDPLRDTVAAFGLGYFLQHAASVGEPVDRYRDLRATVGRLRDAVHPGRLPRAELLELMPLVLDNVRNIRRAVHDGLVGELTEVELTRDLRQWWDEMHKLREDLLDRPEERRFLDYAYIAFLLDESSYDDEIREGLMLAGDVVDMRRDVARKDGRWLAVRQVLTAHVRGLTIALERGIDPDQRADRARKICELAAELACHSETDRYLQQRTSTPADAPSFDGAVVLLLVTLVRGWLVALQAGVPADASQDAADLLDAKASQLETYVAAVRSRREDGSSVPTSRLDPMRGQMADDVLARWRAHVAARPTQAPGSGATPLAP